MTARRSCPACTLVHWPRCPGTTGLRWPLGPLLDAIGATSHQGLMRQLGYSGGTLSQAAVVGLTDAQADRWAVASGMHPAEVWPGWTDAGLTVVDAQFVSGGWRPAWEWTELDRPAAAKGVAA